MLITRMRHCVLYTSRSGQRGGDHAAPAFSLPGGHSEREPPDPIPNSEVKTFCADGSVAVSHVRVGHCQAPNSSPPVFTTGGLFLLCSGSWKLPEGHILRWNARRGGD